MCITDRVKDTRNKDRGVIYEFEFYDREQTMQEDTNMDRKMVNFIREQYPPCLLYTSRCV